MCKKTQFKYCPSRIDSCMKNLIEFIDLFSNWKTVACCCGHGKYPMTIVVKSKCGTILWEIVNNVRINRKKKFYKKDKQGYYYIPEVVNEIQR